MNEHQNLSSLLILLNLVK